MEKSSSIRTHRSCQTKLGVAYLVSPAYRPNPAINPTAFKLETVRSDTEPVAELLSFGVAPDAQAGRRMGGFGSAALAASASAWAASARALTSSTSLDREQPLVRKMLHKRSFVTDRNNNIPTFSLD